MQGEHLDTMETVETAEYTAFVEKFKQKHRKTTDDCYTPPAIYEAVKAWACEEYDIDPAKIVRPFYPGGDYESFDYSNGAVVLDNPPFSVFRDICVFYLERNIPFFLFAPGLTTLSLRRTAMRMCHIITGKTITYENGAQVNTGFVTNLEPDTQIRTAPKLYRRITEVEESGKDKKELPRYEYPPHVLTAAMMTGWSRRGVEFCVKKAECRQIYALDQQTAMKKVLYGRGLLLSSAAEERRNAAAREAERRREAETIVWELSEREWEMVRELDEGKGEA